MIRVLIVDDSPTIRKIIRLKISQHASICVVGEANDPLEAQTLIPVLKPDVLTLDIEMPHMSGLDFLAKLMRTNPLPVVMVSSLTQRSAASTICALQLGAVSCVEKPSRIDPVNSFNGLADLILEAGSARNIGKGRFIKFSGFNAKSGVFDSSYDPGNRIVMIGASTGGVEALFQVISRFPANCPPTLITQHIPANFSKSFAQRLDAQCSPRVVEAEHDLPISKGMVVIAPGSDTHLELAMRPTPFCRLVHGEKVSGHKPSVDVLFKSGVPIGKRISAAILTGMGQDGALGLMALKRSNAQTFAQNEMTCVVYGMPRAAVEMGAVQKTLPLNRIADALLSPAISRPGPR